MNITKTLNGTELCLAIEGNLDTTTSPQLEEEIKQSADGVNRLIIDFTDLEYISSAGLRVLFGAEQLMSGNGELIVRNPNEDVLEILDITGCLDILNVER